MHDGNFDATPCRAFVSQVSLRVAFMYCQVSSANRPQIVESNELLRNFQPGCSSVFLGMVSNRVSRYMAIDWVLEEICGVILGWCAHLTYILLLGF